METFSALLAICAGNSPVPDEFSTQRPVTRSFDVFFDLRLNKQLSKQQWGWWFETPSRHIIVMWSWSQRSHVLHNCYMYVYIRGYFRQTKWYSDILSALPTHLNDNITKHNDVMPRKRFPRHWPFVRGIHRLPIFFYDKERACNMTWNM